MASGEQKRPAMSPPAVQLHEDIIYGNVLPRLPFRLLALLATVCKAWRDVILREASFARLQAQTPSPASAALARFHKGRFEILTPGAAALAPPDASLSFLPALAAGEGLWLCGCTNGLLLCLTTAVSAGVQITFLVVNPATRQFRSIPPYAGEGMVAPCLAYDPATAHREGFHLVVAAQLDYTRYRLWRFSSRDGVWRASREAPLRLELYEKLLSRPSYVAGRVHWLNYGGSVVWHDVAGDVTGQIASPVIKKTKSGYFEGNKALVAWRGRLGMAISCVAGLGVWELASYGGGGGASPARWEMVHWRTWDEIPGVVCPSWCFLWSVMPAGVEAGGEEAIGLEVRMAYMGAVVAGQRQQMWHRVVMRYDLRTGATVTVAELAGKEVHDNLGPVFGYHSSMAALPAINLAA